MTLSNTAYVRFLAATLLVGSQSCGGTTEETGKVLSTDIEEACRRGISCGPALQSLEECEKHFADSLADSRAKNCEKTVVDLVACLAHETVQCEEGHNPPSACLSLIEPMRTCMDGALPDCTNRWRTLAR